MKSVLLSEKQIIDRINELAEQVADDYRAIGVQEDITLIAILKGSVYFLTDFSRALPMSTKLEFMVLSSYGAGTTSSGVIKILKDLDTDISGQHVLVVEDVVDTGNTITWLYDRLLERKPKSLKLVSLLRKPSAHGLPIPVDYIGFELPDEFVVGYGLDYDERYRDMPYIGTLKKEIYSN